MPTSTGNQVAHRTLPASNPPSNPAEQTRRSQDDEIKEALDGYAEYYESRNNSNKHDKLLPTPLELVNHLQHDRAARESLTDETWHSIPLKEKLQIMGDAMKWNRENEWLKGQIDESNAMFKTAGLVWGFVIGAAVGCFGALHGVPEAMLAVPALSWAGYKLNSWITRRHQPPSLDELGSDAIKRIDRRTEDLRRHPEKWLGPGK